MKARLVLCAVVLLSAAAGSRAGATVSATFAFPLAQTASPLPLDPSLSDPAWRAGEVPGDGPWWNVTRRRPADEATSVYVLYDARNLYVGFVCRQPSAPIVATQETNDVGFGTDDFVAVGIDPSGAGSQAYLFETTPRGVRYQQASENVRFRPEWRAAGAIGRDGWRAVMVIPLNVMRLRGGAAQSWRIAFFRRIAACGEHLSWTYDPVMRDFGAGSFPAFGDLRFWPRATEIALRTTPVTKPAPRLEVYGLASGGADRDRYQQADTSFRFQRTRSLGADVSVPITPTINFVGTLGPDFSNVEIDQETIKPQEFARRLTEYRPFFAQGAQYVQASPYGFTNFHAPRNLVFYSPSVGPFDRGAKVEGTYGLQSAGVLSFSGFDARTGERFNDDAFGFRHALPDQRFQYWADGVLAHHSLAGDDTTLEAGASGRNLATGLQWWADEAVERRTGPSETTAHSFNTAAVVQRRNYTAVAEYAEVSPTYDPLDGYTRIADVRGFAGFVNLNGTTPGIKSWSIFLHGDRFTDRSGAVHEAETSLIFSAAFNNGFSINGLGPQLSYLRGYDGDTFSGYPSYRNGVTVPYNLFVVPLGYGDGTAHPIDVSASWGSFGGDRLQYYTAKTSRPLGARYTVGFEYDASYERSLTTGAADAQFLRSLLLGLNMGPSANFTLALRGINGRGGFSAEPGLNVAAALHARTKSGDLYVNFGSPSSAVTLNRLIVKYVLRLGAGAGT